MLWSKLHKLTDVLIIFFSNFVFKTLLFLFLMTYVVPELCGLFFRAYMLCSESLCSIRAGV